VLGGRMRQPRNQKAMQDAAVWDRSGVRRSPSHVDLFRIPFLALSEANRAPARIVGVLAFTEHGATSPPPELRWWAFRGCRERPSQATFAQSQEPTAANSMRAEAQFIFRGGHATVICDVVRVQSNRRRAARLASNQHRAGASPRHILPVCGSR
jgi:hypothetical protein